MVSKWRFAIELYSKSVANDRGGSWVSVGRSSFEICLLAAELSDSVTDVRARRTRSRERFGVSETRHARSTVELPKLLALSLPLARKWQ